MSEPLDLDAIEARLAAATPRPGSRGYTNDRRVRRFVDALPADIPAMIKEIRMLRATLEIADDALSQWEKTAKGEGLVRCSGCNDLMDPLLCHECAPLPAKESEYEEPY